MILSLIYSLSFPFVCIIHGYPLKKKIIGNTLLLVPNICILKLLFV